MYELEQGSKRLATALSAIKDDESTINRLAYLLSYRPSQLKEDIQAVYDRIYSERSKRPEQ